MPALLGHLAASGTSTYASAAGDTRGASLIVVAVTEASSGVGTPTDSLGNSWSGLVEQAGTPACRLYYAANPKTGAAHTFTLTGTVMLSVISVAWFGGVQLASPFDAQSGANNVAFVNGAQPGSILPATAHTLLVSAFAWATALSVTSVTGMALTDQTNFSAAVNYGGGLAYAIQDVPTVFNPTWNFVATVGGSATMAAFKAAWGGSPADTPFRS